MNRPVGKKDRMRIEIWSDVMCPFCYIGKRKFETALGNFAHKDAVEVAWKSFQLDPDLKPVPGRSVDQYLAERKGWPLDHARELNDRVTRSAKAVGLNYDFDKAVVANSFDAHRLVQLGKARGRGDAVEEGLFRAYFTEGGDIADPATLIAIGEEAGLEAAEVEAMLKEGAYADEVRRDLLEARQVGVTGVPFFVIDRKYAISGAQESAVFLRVLEQTWRERQAEGAARRRPV
jgi:predicted DsbA family dithiol-disulfide isomerase